MWLSMQKSETASILSVFVFLLICTYTFHGTETRRQEWSKESLTESTNTFRFSLPTFRYVPWMEHCSLGTTYNQPKLSSCASWNPNATTFTNYSANKISSAVVFVNPNNTLYIAASASLMQALVWTENSLVPAQSLSKGFMQPKGLFITNTSDVYVVNGASNGRIDWCTRIGTIDTIVTNGNETCFSLVTDANDNFYCSLSSSHRVVKQSLNMSSNTTLIVAGNGSSGSSSSSLNIPRGILVTISFDLYVADCGNNRVQLFLSGQLSATTVAGNGASGAIFLSCPVAITLDGNGYLFIVDQNNHRVVGSGLSGFQCILGCSGQNGSATSQLQSPRSLTFDTDGNLMVGDWGNARVQKFVLASQRCGECNLYQIQHR